VPGLDAQRRDLHPLAEAAEWATRDGDRDLARLLAHTADDIEAASVTPAEADAAGLSREATWHPANIMQRLTPDALRNAARYLGPSYVATNAISTAAAIAWSQGGPRAKREVLEACAGAISSAGETTYPNKAEPRARWWDPAPPATAARAARRRKLGLPPAG
jgi:hypothetical protein